MRKFMVHFVAMMVVGVALCEAQESDSTREMVEYTPDYQFREGIFLNFDQVRNNNPLPKSRILTSVDYSDRDFFQKLFEEETIQYFDDFGMRKEVDTEDIWGYSQNGVLYIGLGGGFHRITVIGSICHFLASIISYDGQYYDPYYNRYAFYDYYYYNRRPNNYTKTEVRQFLLDFETGEVVDYDVTNLEVILMKDPELHDEYAALRRRKKKQQKFLFIRRFNERNPVYLPAVD